MRIWARVELSRVMVVCVASLPSDSFFLVDVGWLGCCGGLVPFSIDLKSDYCEIDALICFLFFKIERSSEVASGVDKLI